MISNDGMQIVGNETYETVPIKCCMYMPGVYIYYNIAYDQFKQAQTKHIVYTITSNHGTLV